MGFNSGFKGLTSRQVQKILSCKAWYCFSNWQHKKYSKLTLLFIFWFYFSPYDGISRTTLTEVFPCFFLSCKANARVNPAKTGHGPHFHHFCVFLCIFVLFYVFLCCSMYFLCCSMYFLCCSMYFRVVLCIFCVVLCIFVLFYVLFVLCRSRYCLCVYVYWTTATGWLPNCS